MRALCTHGRVPADLLAHPRVRLHAWGMFDDLRMALRGLPEAAHAAVDDESAARIAHAVAMTLGSLDRLARGATPERVANRAPATQRCLLRLRAELRRSGKPGWRERVEPVRERLQHAHDELAALVTARAEFARAVAQVLREAA